MCMSSASPRTPGPVAGARGRAAAHCGRHTRAPPASRRVVQSPLTQRVRLGWLRVCGARRSSAWVAARRCAARSGRALRARGRGGRDPAAVPSGPQTVTDSLQTSIPACDSQSAPIAANGSHTHVNGRQRACFRYSLQTISPQRRGHASLFRDDARPGRGVPAGSMSRPLPPPSGERAQNREKRAATRQKTRLCARSIGQVGYAHVRRQHAQPAARSPSAEPTKPPKPPFTPCFP